MRHVILTLPPPVDGLHFSVVGVGTVRIQDQSILTGSEQSTSRLMVDPLGDWLYWNEQQGKTG